MSMAAGFPAVASGQANTLLASEAGPHPQPRTVSAAHSVPVERIQ